MSRRRYLDAMRQVAHSVAVVTTDGRAGRHGATVTAFCSVSADPPTLLVCLRTNSRISAMVAANGVFTLNILADDARTVARAFTGEFDMTRPDRFEGVALIEQDGLAPALRDATSFSCRTLRAEIQHTHTIFYGMVAIARVCGLSPLTYHDGAYCGVRRDLEPALP